MALTANATGFDNTATGVSALQVNTTGDNNTATGYLALTANATGFDNTATGVSALQVNSTGFGNTANGRLALFSNTTGSDNTGTGVSALLFNMTGNNNTATGNDALSRNTTGSDNIALGFQAGQNLNTGNHNIYIGNAGGGGGESRRIRIGTVGTHTKTFVAGISGVTVPDGVGVIVGSNGQLGTVVSSARFKENVKPLEKASEAILSLQPVSFRYKKELDPDCVPQFGLIAEEVAKVDPDLVARDEQGQPYTVRYEAVNAMLLNEFLKEHSGMQDLKNTVGKQEAMIAQQQEEIQALTAALKAQAAQIQKVSNEIELIKPAPRTVANNH